MDKARRRHAQKPTGTQKQRLLRAAVETYGVEGDHPFSGDSVTTVLRHSESRRWFALIMRIPRNRLYPGSEGVVDAVNLKSSPLMLGSLIQEDGIFPAYHMNRSHWISVVLDGSVPDDTLFSLLDMSYRLTSGKAGGRSASHFRISRWIVPANPRWFDLEEILRPDESGTFLFKQSSRVEVGDTVYLYVAAPVSAIRYKCEAVEVNIPDDYKDEHVTVKRLMRLRVLQEYADPPIGLALMREHGVTTVRGPRGMPLSLQEEIEHRYGGR
ncbi:MAG: MmcQ/YjbR family DNA-binding protein [Oscillospiraceae bacterium]|nr:MmcQ/YjbR family DNA-binding protein [Oscillospiraceae bacterium]